MVAKRIRTPDPNWKLIRIRTITRDRIVVLAKEKGTTPPQLLDEMLKAYEFLTVMMKGTPNPNEPSHN